MAALESIQNSIIRLRHVHEEFAKCCLELNNDYLQGIRELEKQEELLVKEMGKIVCPNCREIIKSVDDHYYMNFYYEHGEWCCPYLPIRKRVILEL